MMNIKKARGTKKCVIKIKLKSEGYKNCLVVAQTENKINHLGKTTSMQIVLNKIIKNS